MKRIFKYELIAADHSKLCLPIGVRILSVEVQRGSVCLWASVDDYRKEVCFVDVYTDGTGGDVSDAYFAGKRFAGTVQLGDFVCRVFLEYGEVVQYRIV